MLKFWSIYHNVNSTAAMIGDLDTRHGSTPIVKVYKTTCWPTHVLVQTC